HEGTVGGGGRARANAGRAPHERQRPIDDVRQDPVGTGCVVAREGGLRGAGGGEEHPVGMRDADAGDRRPHVSIMPSGVWVARQSRMSDVVRRRVAVDVPWRTLLKLIAAIALIWVWLQIYQLVLLLVVAVLLAVSLDPVVGWVQRRGLPRWGAATLVGVTLLALIVGFVMMTWSSLSDQAQDLGKRLPQFERQVNDRLPQVVRNAIGMKSGGASELQSAAMPYALQFVRALAGAVAGFAPRFTPPG